MASSMHPNQFPGESSSYREARNQLLQAEMTLRKSLEEVATLRRKLPLGGEIPEDYIFDEGAPDLEDSTTTRKTRISELFQPGKDTLAIYSFMYGPKMKAACPACTSILDSLNGTAPHASQRINLAVVARNPLEKIRAMRVPAAGRICDFSRQQATPTTATTTERQGKAISSRA
jgi:predicted dithiol-disulfide oxidoreductase (DUF899 family)